MENIKINGSNYIWDSNKDITSQIEFDTNLFYPSTNVVNINNNGKINITGQDTLNSQYGNFYNGIGIALKWLNYNINMDNITNTNEIISNFSGILSNENMTVGNGIGIYGNNNSIKNITNNGIILGQLKNSGVDSKYDNTNGGNGIGITSYKSNSISIIENIKNTGKIKGYSENIDGTDSNIGNGIGNYAYSQSKISNIMNNGEITGYSENITTANVNGGNGIGIYSKGNEVLLDSFFNIGNILGNTKLISQNNINSGNGLGMFSAMDFINIGIINNTGNISGNIDEIIQDNQGGKINNIGNGIGIYSKGNTNNISEINNSGYILGSNLETKNSENNVGNGIGIYHSKLAKYGANLTTNIEKIINEGAIKGFSKLGSTNEYGRSNNNIGNGLGLYLYASGNDANYMSHSFKVNSLENKGSILGNSDGIVEGYNTMGGNGISFFVNGNKDSEAIIDKYLNLGIVAGVNKGINFYINPYMSIKANINNYNNLGIVAGKVPVSLYKDDNMKAAGSGLALILKEKDTTTGKIKVEKIFAGDGGENNGYFVVNTFDKTTEDKPIESDIYNQSIQASDLKNKVNTSYIQNDIYTNIVLNGIDKTLTVNEDVSVKDSIINGFESTIFLSGENKFTGENIVINGGGLGSMNTNNNLIYSPVILGDADNNNIELKGKSLINGGIDLKEGEDNILISGLSQINGDISSDNDNITLEENVIMNGDITGENTTLSLLGKGSSTLFDVGALTINGDINLRNSTLDYGDNIKVNGNINLVGENATILVGENTLTLDKNINISATNKNLKLKYSINTENNLNNLKTQINSFKDFNIKLGDNGNSNVKLDNLGILSIEGGKGDDIFILSNENNMDIVVKDLNNQDNDILQLGFSINGKEEKLSDKYDGIETLKLADLKNTIDILDVNFKNIIGGNQDDTFNNVSKDKLENIVGGNGTDSILMNESIEVGNNSIENIVVNNSIENIILSNNGNNKITLSTSQYLKNIDFGTGSNNNLILIKQENILDFSQQNLITGNVNIDLNNNIINIGEASLVSGKLNLNTDFINGGKVNLNNGKIKFELRDNILFNHGIYTEYNLNLDKLTLGSNISLETYAFLNVNENKLTVKTWEELTKGMEEIYNGFNGNYNSALYDYNTKNHDSLTNAFNKWTSKEIADYIINKQKDVITKDEILEANNMSYKNIIIENNFKIDTSNGAIDNLVFDTISGKDIVINNDLSIGNGNIHFNGTTSLGNLDLTSSSSPTTINFDKKSGNKISIGNISFGNVKNNIINIVNSSDINEIGIIGAENNGHVNINIIEIGNSSEGFYKILSGANSGNNNSITVTNQANGLELNTEYRGTLTFNGQDNNVSLGNTIGNLIMGSGNDTVTLDISKFINDNDIVINVDGKEGKDIFNISSSVSSLKNSLNQKLAGKTLIGSINSFENININENINLASNLKITGTKNIVIGNEKELGLNIDYNQTKDGKVIGHALYNNGIVVNNDNGKIVVETSTANEDTVISMGNEDTASIITNGNNIFTSNSINHTVTYDRDNNVINVTVKKDLELGKNETIKYAHLNEIYKSIFDANKTYLMRASSEVNDNKTEDEAIKAQLEFYGKIYNSTPYAYSNDISRETTNMINNSIMDSRFKADEGRWLHYGAIAGQGYDDDNSYYGRGYYNSVDLGVAKVNIKSDIYSAYYMGEYGKTDKLALGYVIAGNNSNTDIGESDLKGSGYYLGTYAKYNTEKLKLIAGVGYQHNYYEADRRVSNDYQSMAFEKKYKDDTLTAYSGVRYIHNLTDDLTAEPYAKLTLTHVMQHSINEADNGDLSISVAGKDFTTVDSEIGVNLVKSTTVKDGKVNLIAGVGAEIMLDGYEKENLTAKINGSNKTFDIVSEEEENFKGKVSLGVEYEKINGVFYNAKGSYIKTEDNNNYKFEIGIGYKF